MGAPTAPRPATNQRRLRTVRRHVPATGAYKRDHDIDGAGTAEALFAFLEAAIHAMRAKTLFGFDAYRMVVLSHRVLLSGAGLLLTPVAPQLLLRTHSRQEAFSYSGRSCTMR